MIRIILASLLLSNFVLAAKLTIKSNPLDAQVFIVDLNTGKEKALGKTPYDANLNDIVTDKTKAIQMKVFKNGFEPFNFILPPLLSTDVKINANLTVVKDIKLTQDFDLLVTDLFDALRMARMQDYTSANLKLDMLLEKFPQFSIIYEMKGMNFYLQKEFKRALNFYRKAFAVNPKNREAFRMKVYLEKKFNLSEEVQ